MMGININPYEMMWDYIRFKWNWEGMNKREKVFGILFYPLLAPFFLLLLGYKFAQYYFWKAVFYVKENNR